MTLRTAGITAGWAVGIVAFAVAISWFERETNLSLGPSLAVGATVALIWVTRTYVLATKRLADDQATMLELQRRSPYRAALVDFWILATRSMRLTAEANAAFEYAVTNARNFDDAFAKLEESHRLTSELSTFATEVLGAAGSLDPSTPHGDMAADHSIALLTYCGTAMTEIVSATNTLAAQRTAGSSHRLPAVPKPYADAYAAISKETTDLLSAINDELGVS